MAYTKTNWVTGDVISSTRLNHAEQGIYDNSVDITELKNDLDAISDETYESIDTPFASGIIRTNIAIGEQVDTSTIVDSNAYTHLIISCNEFDKFKITGAGADSGRLWAFTTTDSVLISKSSAYLEATDLIVTAPSDGYLIINSDKWNHQIAKRTLHIITDKTLTIQDVSADAKAVGDAFDTLKNRIFKEALIDQEDSFLSGYIKTNVVIGETVDINRISSTQIVSAIIPCSQGDKFVLTGTGGNNPRVWAFCDTEYHLLSKATNDLSVADLELTASADGYFIVNVYVAQGYSLEMLQLVVDIQESYTDILDNFAQSVGEVAVVGGNWSSDTIPDHGTTTEYTAIASYNPTLSELYGLYDALVTAHPTYITKTDLGLDQSGEYHLYKYSFVPESISIEGTGTFTIPDMPKILLGSGTHGNGQDAGDEPEMVVGVYYFFKNICDNWYGNDALTYLRHHVHIELIPVQNPWGYVNKSRRNSRQVDINSNFPVGWTQGEQGSNTYGGTAPFSEAESVIIKNFVEANTDALFYLDLHTTGGTQTQAHMIYYSMVSNKNLIVPANDTVIYLSDKWNHESIANLDTTIMHGFIHRGGTGRGEIYTWVNSNIGIPACVMEAFPNFENSGLSKNSELVMRMCQEELVTFIIKCIRYFKFNYLSNQR